MKKVFFVQSALSLGLLISASQLSAQTWTQTGPVSPSTVTSRSGNVGIGTFSTGGVYTTPTALLHMQQSAANATPDISITRDFATWNISHTTNGLEFSFPYTGGTTATPLRLAGANVTVPAGTLGIGTAAPASSTARLAVNGNIKMGSFLYGTATATVPFRIVADNAAANVNPYIEMYSNNSTVANTKGNIHFITNSSSGNTGQYRFGTQNGNTWTTMMVIDANGAVSIGANPTVKYNAQGNTSSNNLYKLFVGGGILSQEISVKLAEGSFPDYVFDDNYKLLPLSEVKQYIEENKHLPNMPSAEEVEKGDMNIKAIILKQQEKIEELTLYLLEQEKKQVMQQEKIEALEKALLEQK